MSASTVGMKQSVRLNFSWSSFCKEYQWKRTSSFLTRWRLCTGIVGSFCNRVKHATIHWRNFLHCTAVTSWHQKMSIRLVLNQIKVWGYVVSTFCEQNSRGLFLYLFWSWIKGLCIWHETSSGDCVPGNGLYGWRIKERRNVLYVQRWSALTQRSLIALRLDDVIAHSDFPVLSRTWLTDPIP